jgi:transposase
MQGKNRSQPALFQMVDIEGLVPATHRLRKIDAVLDLSFVHEAVADCYSEKRGRPGIDLELALRMMLLGRLYDLSDRELCDEIGMHVGKRWFCRLNLHDPVPDHSTLSRPRNERWAESGLFQRLFDEVVRQCSAAGLVSGRHVSVDGSEVRANASMKSLARVEPAPQAPRQPSGGADEPEPSPGEVAAKEPQPKGGWTGHGVRYGNQTHRSRSDPDARLYRKGKGKEARLCYLMHDVIDTKSRVILRRKVSHAHSSTERTSLSRCWTRCWRSRARWGFRTGR